MEQLFGAIPAVLNILEPNVDIDKAIVFAAWARCAGELLRERTVPLEFVEKNLVIAVQDKTWQRHLEELSPEMLFKINGSLGQGTVKFIEFSVDVKAVKRANERKVIAAEADISDLAPSLTAAANAISDESLRKQFLTAAASYLAKQQQG